MNSQLKIVLVRHSITEGNLAHQYIGSTDQPLCREGIALAKAAASAMPKVEQVYRSPMLRCRQTAELLFPAHTAREVLDLREADFGICEGKTYIELSVDPAYQEWISSAGALPPPGGEGAVQFSARCVSAFCGMIDELEAQNISSCACVIHGGSIMAVMHALASPKRDFYNWQVKNCCGFITTTNPKSHHLTLLQELNV